MSATALCCHSIAGQADGCSVRDLRDNGGRASVIGQNSGVRPSARILRLNTCATFDYSSQRKATGVQDKGVSVSRSLRKLKLDGTPYFRRDMVESEIQDLADVSASELERRAGLWSSREPGFISPEALLYFVRNAAPGAYRERLTEKLLGRVASRVRPITNSGGDTVSLTGMNIREEVVDHFVDLLLSDRNEYDERLDYYEVNFNAAIAADRHDANVRHWKHENRNDELETEDGDVTAQVESAVGSYDPFESDEFDKKDYRLLLDDAIDRLPELQRRIVVMWRQDIPIESNDPSVESISKVLGKSEKTIRTHRDRAFASLKRFLEGKGKVR